MNFLIEKPYIQDLAYSNPPPPKPFAEFTRPEPTPSNPTAWIVLAIACVMISLKTNQNLK